MTGAPSADTDGPRFPKLGVEPFAPAVVRNLPAAPITVSNRDHHRLNNRLAVALVMVVAAAPIPLASNRPAIWMLWAVVIGLISLYYGVRLYFLDAPVRVPLGRFWPEATLLVGLGLYLGVQILPLGHWIAPVSLADGSRITPPSLSLAPGDSLLVLINFAMFGLLFFLFAQVAANRRRARGMLLALFFVVAAFAVYGLVSLTQLGDTLLGFEKRYYTGYATATFINRNSYATFLASGLAMGVPLLIDGLGSAITTRNARRWTVTAVVVAGIVFIVAALLASGSRMGAIAGLTGAVLTFVVGLFTTPDLGRARNWLVIVAVLIAAAMVALYGTGVLERAVLTHDEDGRGELYRQVWAAIWQRPWLGYGGGSFAAAFPLFQHAPLAGDVVWDHAHSTYLALWFEFGLIFGSIPLLVVGILALRAVFGLRDKSSSLLALAAAGVAVVFAIHSSVDFSAEILANAFLLIAVLALGASSSMSTKPRQDA